MWLNRNDVSDLKLLGDTWPAVPPDSNYRQAVVNILNTTLADEAVLCIKTRGALLSVRGVDVNDQHMLFEFQYKQLNVISDEILNRIRVLGIMPSGSFGEFLKYTRLEEQPGNAADIMHLLADHEAAIRFLREDAKRCIEEYEDQVTHDFLVAILRLHEKMAWMLRACIEPEMTHDERLKNKALPA
jgi:starvation-inducible DNA-binding protein